MRATRPRRIVRRAVIALAVVVLLVAWYVSAWLLVTHATQRSIIDGSVALRIRPVFEPLRRHAETRYPGASMLSQLWWATWRLEDKRQVIAGNPPALAFAPFPRE